MEFDGSNAEEHTALVEIATTVSNLKRSVVHAGSNEQVRLALYLMDMILIAVDKDQADDLDQFEDH